MNHRASSVLSVVVALACVGAASAGCGAEERSPGARPSTGAARSAQGGFVHVQLRAEHHWARVARPERTDVELWAVFVHYWNGDPEDVALTLGIDAEEQTVQPGSCALVTPGEPLPVEEWDDGDGELSVELLDAGSLVVSLPGHTELLTGKPYPELLPSIAGMHYRHRWSAQAEGVSTERVGVYGLGEGDVRAFELTGISGPAEVRLTSVGGWRPADGPVVVSQRDPLALRWEPGRPALETRVRLRWKRSRKQRAGELLCRPRRGGRLTIPRSWLARIPIGSMGTPVHLTVETTARAEQAGPLPGPVDVRVTQADNLYLLLVR